VALDSGTNNPHYEMLYEGASHADFKTDTNAETWKPQTLVL
jgi:hypothetical protein